MFKEKRQIKGEMERVEYVGLSDGGGNFGFDCDCEYGDGFRFHLEIWSCGSGINWGKIERNSRKKVEGVEGMCLSLSCFIRKQWL